MITEQNAPFLDAVALIRANQRRDGEAVRQVLDTADVHSVAIALAQMVQTAIRTQGMSLDGFLEMQIDRSIEAAAKDEGYED